MDNQELNQILQSSSKRALLYSKLEEAKARFAELTRYSINGGTFQIDRALMRDVRDMISESGYSHNVLLDHYGLPVLITDMAEFKIAIFSKYEAAIRRFYLDVKAARESQTPDLFDV